MEKKILIIATILLFAFLSSCDDDSTNSSEELGTQQEFAEMLGAANSNFEKIAGSAPESSTDENSPELTFLESSISGSLKNKDANKLMNVNEISCMPGQTLSLTFEIGNIYPLIEDNIEIICAPNTDFYYVLAEPYDMVQDKLTIQINLASEMENGEYYIRIGLKDLSSGLISNYESFSINIDDEKTESWVKYIGTELDEFSNGIIKTNDGNLLIAASVETQQSGNYDASLIKMNLQGKILWQKTYPGTDVDYCIDVAETSDGFLAVGMEDVTDYASKIRIIKTNKNGGLVWEKSYGDNLINWPKSFSLTNDGGCIIAGYRKSGFMNCFENVYVIKLNSSGDIQWENEYFKSDGRNLCNSIIQTSDGGYLCVGWTFYTEDGKGFRSIYVIKIANNGSKIWDKTIGDYENVLYEGFTVIENENGGFIIGGRKYKVDEYLNYSDFEIILINTDANANVVWEKTVGKNQTNCQISKIVKFGANSYIASATYPLGLGNLDGGVFSFDSKGNLLWEKPYGDSESDGMTSIVMCGNGYWASSGYTTNKSNGKMDVMVVLNKSE